MRIDAMVRSGLALYLAGLFGCSGATDETLGVDSEATCEAGADTVSRSQRARGAFTCDFGMPGGLPLELVAPAIERDRMYMSAEPGLVRKLLPIAVDPTSGDLFSGGRYLFDTRQQASDYRQFVEHDYVLDGVQFLSRPIFLGPECHDYSVIGEMDLEPDFATDAVMRTERFATPDTDALNALRDSWSAIQKAAKKRGYHRVSLLHDESEHLAALVYVAGRAGPYDGSAPDVASLAALEGAAALGAPLLGRGFSRVFDRTHWIFTTWFPFRRADRGQAALWPNSPPFPAPTCGDGVCEPSRGEAPTGCASDCAPACGNGHCDANEDTMRCPSDCRP